MRFDDIKEAARIGYPEFDGPDARRVELDMQKMLYVSWFRVLGIVALVIGLTVFIHGLWVMIQYSRFNLGSFIVQTSWATVGGLIAVGTNILFINTKIALGVVEYDIQIRNTHKHL